MPAIDDRNASDICWRGIFSSCLPGVLVKIHYSSVRAKTFFGDDHTYFPEVKLRPSKSAPYVFSVTEMLKSGVLE